ncbi:MAG: methionine adenosyltransferase [Alphaproteobacteria bacterium]|nr:methionine adenosyltransferase [Alphaproteobacteria bacterium]
MTIEIGLLAAPAAADAAFEVVERKGLGHPDTICDALAEAVSLRLSRYYLERFGLILHHNVDKVLLRGGVARPAFGTGEVVEPIEIFLAGRATKHYRDVAVPVDDLAIDAAKDWLRRHCHALDVDRHVCLHPLFHPGSADLVELYVRQQKNGVWLANDTSCGVGFAPLSTLEALILATEQRLNADATRKTQPAIGEDIKVMGVRHRGHIHLTIGCAVVGRFVRDMDAYLRVKSWIADQAQRTALDLGDAPASIHVNAADDPASGSVYLTVTGTSAEAGDDGEAGRGNRVNGLITPGRPTTMESVAGKNPVTHVGKLYNLSAGLAAQSLVERVPDVKAAQCIMVSEIGRPIDQPAFVGVEVSLAEQRRLDDLKPAINDMVRAQIAAIPELRDALVEGRIALDRWPLQVHVEVTSP